MNMFDYAMDMEKEGESFYRKLSEQTNNRGLKTILTWLAEEEVKHFNIFQSMKNNVIPEMAQVDLLKNARDVFAKMDRSIKEAEYESTQGSLYMHARELEQKTRDFYLAKAKEVENQEQKYLFARIAEEEKKHYFLLDNIIEFIKRPDIWLENAEFCHLEEY